MKFNFLTSSQWETVCDDMATFNDTCNRFVAFFNIDAIPGTEQTYYFDNLIQPGATSTSNLLNDKAVTIYPNPATHNLFFDTEGQPLTIIVSDMMGREMLRHHEYTNNNIRVSDFNAGTYIVTFIDEATGQIANSKFIKK